MTMLGFLTPQTRNVKVFIQVFIPTTRHICSSANCQSEEYVRKFILENTEIAGQQSLTPQVKLRLFTPNCRFWRERPELWPFEDPYWAIYWPGGQALSRFLLDNPAVCRGKTVLDLGSGCGASAIAAKLSGATHVVANDIDTGMYAYESCVKPLCMWLDRCIKTHGTKVLIGDPGRAQFEEHGIRRLLHQLAEFELPKSVREENYGLTCSSVWCYRPEL
ncbi:electron transfer flavoprotein beta subunit lysine methyltransferase [Notothenia coriiceps]|uniref:Electron transfer flavoprotein beta subunit lysine methyltransferase n=1 Tax=Notothenia coriiceps TaxID=8208 RepID=A0A6I9P5G8_9TELE|nr:PREDICTED: protein N-lysine methyltransferase METTL20 [Notothenia coriiceps]